MAVSNDGANRVMMSTNGANWSQPGTPISNGSWELDHVRERFVRHQLAGAVWLWRARTVRLGRPGSAPSKNWRAVLRRRKVRRRDIHCHGISIKNDDEHQRHNLGQHQSHPDAEEQLGWRDLW